MPETQIFKLLVDKFKGTCLVLGSGPSLKNIPKDIPVFKITCNHSAAAFPFSLNYFQDKEYLPYVNQDSPTIYIHSTLTDKIKMPGIKVKRYISSGRKYIHDLDHPYISINSGPQACHIAHLLGFEKIIVAGLDASPDQAYLYHQPHPRKGKRNINIESHPMQISRQFDELRSLHRPYNLVNLTNSNWAPKSDIKVLEGLEPNQDACMSMIREIISQRSPHSNDQTPTPRKTNQDTAHDKPA